MLQHETLADKTTLFTRYETLRYTSSLSLSMLELFYEQNNSQRYKRLLWMSYFALDISGCGTVNVILLSQGQHTK